MLLTLFVSMCIWRARCLISSLHLQVSVVLHERRLAAELWRVHQVEEGPQLLEKIRCGGDAGRRKQKSSNTRREIMHQETKQNQVVFSDANKCRLHGQRSSKTGKASRTRNQEADLLSIPAGALDSNARFLTRPASSPVCLCLLCLSCLFPSSADMCLYLCIWFSLTHIPFTT